MSKGKWIIGGVVALVVIGAVSNGGEDNPQPQVNKPAAKSAAPKPTAVPDAPSTKKAPEKSAVQQFKAFVSKNGTPAEAAAVRHVTKIQGGEKITDILDTADIYTDFTGGMMGPHANDGKLIASAFGDWQSSRGKSSENGLVTVYDSSAEMLSNGKF
ncbi:hypothetical protein [Streptomyces lavendulocolor]|uniref:hypothetical protein n=1 Tax=Streptomyces lavendulocolor TaxID=67316 RepID=UPI003C2C6D4D